MAAIALVATLTPSICRAQDSVTAPSDVRTPTQADSAAVRRDSIGVDSARVDSIARPRDSVTARPPAPVDSVLGAACGASGGAPPDLIVVKFRPGTTVAERAAVAQEVGGTVSGPSEHAAPGSWFLLVPGGAGDRSLADRLIQMPPVLEVGVTRCPS